jgi:hypothetical protein
VTYRAHSFLHNAIFNVRARTDFVFRFRQAEEDYSCNALCEGFRGFARDLID